MMQYYGEIVNNLAEEVTEKGGKTVKCQKFPLYLIVFRL